MTMTDPIADLLTRIRNAQQARHALVRIPASRMKVSIVEILKEEGYIVDFARAAQRPQDVIEVTLKYGNDGRGAITGMVRQSKPGRRVYVGNQQIPRVKNGLGVAIVSTSAGVLSDHAARKKQVGGELLLTIW
jgi:small subunit ribosomal protein S8